MCSSDLVALRELLGIDSVEDSTASQSKNADASASDVSDNMQRLVVVERESQVWAFDVDEVAGVSRFPLSELGNVPATVANSLARYSRGVFLWNEKAIGFLDDERLFEQLRRAVG